MIASKGVTNLSGSSCCSASCALVNIDGKILYHAVGKACTWWREAWGEAEDAVARSGRVGGVRLLRCAVATATVHGRVRPRLRLRCMASAASRWVAGAWLVGAWLAGARQVSACLLVDELPHGALGAVAQCAVAVHRVRVARLAEVLPQLRELVLVLVVVREAVGAEHVQGVRRVLLAGEQAGEQACRQGHHAVCR